MIEVTIVVGKESNRAKGRSVESIARRRFGKRAFVQQVSSELFDPKFVQWRVLRSNEYGTHVLGTIISYPESPETSTNPEPSTVSEAREDDPVTQNEGDGASTAMDGDEVFSVSQIRSALRTAGINYVVLHAGTDIETVRVGDLAIGPATTETGRTAAGIDSYSDDGGHDWHRDLASMVERAWKHVKDDQ